MSPDGRLGYGTRVIRATSLAFLLLLTVSLPALASEELVPAELGGAPAEVVAFDGPALLASLDPSDDVDADRIAGLESLLAVTGRPVDALSVAAAYPAEGTAGGWVAAIRLTWVDPAVLRALVLAGIREDLDSPVQEDATIAGRSAVYIVGAGGPPLALYGSGDTVWLLGGTASEVAAILEQLP